MIRLRLVSDGTPAGTALVDMATGEPVDSVVRFRLKVEEGKPNRAEVTIVDLPIDIVADARVLLRRRRRQKRRSGE